jgi:LEA14-like dessication related protein
MGAADSLSPFIDADTAKLLDGYDCSLTRKGTLVMKRLRALVRKPRYRHLAIAFFVASVILCSFGSASLSVEYSAVFDTFGRFGPYVVALTKGIVSEDSRLITVYLKVPNSGTRPIYLYEYGVYLYLNDHAVAQRDIFPNLTLQPGSNDTLLVQFTVTTGYVQYIIDAEQTDQWNWIIRFPMRLYVGWLTIRASQLGQTWSGIEEVP